MIQSKALEVNIADYHVEVSIDEKYAPMQDAMSQYYGIIEGLNTFLKELSHPYKNWTFIVKEARGYALDYFHLLARHEKGAAAAALFLDIFFQAVEEADKSVKTDAADNLVFYLIKIAGEAGAQLPGFISVIDDACKRIGNYDDARFLLFVQSFYPLERLAETLLRHFEGAAIDFESINRLMIKYLKHTYQVWLSVEEPLKWFEKEASIHRRPETFRSLFEEISHDRIKGYLTHLESGRRIHPISSPKLLFHLAELPGYLKIVKRYREIPQDISAAVENISEGNRLRLIFLFYIMNVSGLSVIHEETLRDINRTVAWIIDNESSSRAHKVIDSTFSILKERIGKYPSTALNCILNMGRGVYKTGDFELVNFFIDRVIDLGFQAPEVAGVEDNWQIKANAAHIQNIRVWLELIELKPKWSSRFISYLIIHLSLFGVFIKDTDLFPREITRLLNSDVGPVYNLCKQLARIFPVYFNEIGAEGKLRDISTRIDEISGRRDVLVHFLRKQSHVESNNRIIGFMEAIFQFWRTCDKTILKPYVPPEIYRQISGSGRYTDGLHAILTELDSRGVSIPEGFLQADRTPLEEVIEAVSGISAQDAERLQLAIELYRMLHQKYRLDFIDLTDYLNRLKAEAFPELDKLSQALQQTELKNKIFDLLEFLEILKSLILSNERYSAREDIYKKRHIAVDIPSMYGSYHETKFDALGLTFRIEALVNVLFEEFVGTIDLSLITKATFYQIYDLLMLFDKALRLDGIASAELERQLDFLAHSLEATGFTFTQYLDVFKGFAQAVKNIINDYFHNIHDQNLARILSQATPDQILPKYLPAAGKIDLGNLKHRISEIFFRDRLSLSLGLPQLDLFLSRILNTLFNQSNKLPADRLRTLLNYDPKRALTSLRQPNNLATGIIYLGNKGLNMMKMINFDLPVPPGFIVTTEVFRCKDIVYHYSPAEENFKEQVIGQIHRLEKETARTFGDPSNPLLLSVRSGASISQPGMMDTFLDVGMNEQIAEGIAHWTGNEWFAWDNYRRFLQCYGMAYGLERDDFDAIISELKRRAGVSFKREFTGQQMRKVALTYKDMIRENGIEITDDPLDQLLMAIQSVLSSWESSKARTYRRIIGISDDWGTAVTVQKMVFGNISSRSGSGVFFTHNPRWPGDALRLWGDFTLGNQGEDVVSGLVRTMPISLIQQEFETRETDVTLETHFPEIYKALKEWASQLIYRRGWSPQEMEFTFETPSKSDLYLLQSRDMSIRERKKVLTFDVDRIAGETLLGHGIGVSGGAMSGRVVFSLEDIDTWHKKEPDTKLILARSDTVPDDIREIFAADGLLTAKGGLTSHAAVVAHRLGKTCVVGCGNLICNEAEKHCFFNQARIKSGDFISIDGHEGSVYHGRVPSKAQ